MCEQSTKGKCAENMKIRYNVNRAGPVVLVGGAAALAPQIVGAQSYMYAVYYI